MTLPHLLAELSRIDLLVQRAVLQCQLAGQDPRDDFRGLRLTDADAVAIAARPFGTSWAHTVSLDPRDEESFQIAFAQTERAARSAAEDARERGEPMRLASLARAFGLQRFDLDILLIALAPALDTRYERLYGYLQDDITRKRPSVGLALDLLCEPGPERLVNLAHFADDAPLFQRRLLERTVEPNAHRPSLLSQTLIPDESVVAWLLGDYQPHTDLGSHARLDTPQADATDEVLSAPVWTDLQHAADDRKNGQWPALVFFGPDGAGQLAAARRLAAHLNRQILSINLSDIISPELPPAHVLAVALRDARMIGAIPLLTGWDACLTDGAPPPNEIGRAHV